MPVIVRARAASVLFAAFVVVLLSWLPRPAMACASCGCSLSSNAAMGYTSRPGWVLSLQYDYIDQNQLRHGTGSASTPPVGQEFEKQTLNQYITAGLTYAPDSKWNLRLLLPYVIRDHTTYGTYSPPSPLVASDSHSSSIGDAKLIANYQGFLPTRNLGVQFGVKLPTGAYGNAVNFSSGPLAGTPLDASLQPGTGSTDLILGGYYYRAISQNYDAFGELSYQSAVATRDDYRPGDKTTLTAGLRYEAHPKWTPQLQLNIAYKGSDTGLNGDPANTAGMLVYLSPGITAAVAKKSQLYGFLQVPVYWNLDGYQLMPEWTASLGWIYRF
jgi:hypothetical protein